MHRFYQAAIAVFALVGSALYAQGIPGLTFTQIPIPQPRDINPSVIGAGTGGRIWFTDQTFQQVGYFGPDNSITKFRLIDSASATNGVRPKSIVEGPDGNGWFTGFVTDSSGTPLNRSFVGRVTPAGAITYFSMPTGNGCGPLEFIGHPGCGITTGPDGSLWFTETGATVDGVKKVGRITLAGQVTEFAITLPDRFLYLVDIATGADGNLWVTDNGRSSIWRLTTQGAFTEFRSLGAGPLSITKGPDENLWFTAPGNNSIGRITPAGTITLFPVPVTSGNARLSGIVTGPDGNIWFTEFADKQIGQLIPSTGAVAEAAVPNGDAPAQIIAGSIIFNAANAVNDFNIHRGKVDTPPPTAAPNLEITKTADQTKVERGVDVFFEIRVENKGDAATTISWEVQDMPGTGLEQCELRDAVDRDNWSESRDSRGVLIFTPNASSLPKGGVAIFSIRCIAVGSGPKTNRVVVTGGGSSDKSATATVVAYEPRINIPVTAFLFPSSPGRR